MAETNKKGERRKEKHTEKNRFIDKVSMAALKRAMPTNSTKNTVMSDLKS